MSGFPLILALIIAILILGVVVTLISWRGSKGRRGRRLREPNYRTFFKMGIVWFSAGIVGMILLFFVADLPMAMRFILPLPLLAMGLVYLMIGLANRDRWRTSR